MKKLLFLVLALASVLPAFAVRNNVVVAAVQAVSATGALSDVDVGPYTRAGTFDLVSLNTAGTSPTLAVKLQSSALPVVGQTSTTVGSTLNELNEGATTKVKLAAKFTQSGARSIKYVDLRLEKEGTLTAGKLLTLTINTNSAGVPSATVLGTANTVDIDTYVTTSFTWVRFTFPTAVDVSDSTIYHLVLTTDYTASGSNNVIWRSATVASAGNQSTHNATIWSAVTTESQEFINYDATFTDVTSGAYTGLTTGANRQSLTFNLDGTLSGLVRPYATIGGSAGPNYYLACLLNAESR